MTVTVAIQVCNIVRRSSWADPYRRVEFDPRKPDAPAWHYSGQGDIIGSPWIPTNADLRATDWKRLK